jgi:hypothetical protein
MLKEPKQPIVLKPLTHKLTIRNRPGLDLQAAYTALISAYEQTLRQTPTTASSPQPRTRREK